MNFTHLRAFHAVAREGGFTRAAARLSISQPAVTVQVRALERAYGIELFKRHGQGAVLTPFGEQVFERARRVFARLDDLEELLSSAGGLRRGDLQIGADGPYAVMDLLAAFTARYPEIRTTVRIGNAKQVLADLREGRTDVAVVNLLEAGHGLACLTLGQDRVVAFVGRQHALARRRRIALRALDGQAMVLREHGSATREVFLRAVRRAGVAPRTVLELGSREAVREAVAAGLGAGVVFATELGRDERLRPLEIVDAKLAAEQSLACLPERRDLRVVQALYGLAQAMPAGRIAGAGEGD